MSTFILAQMRVMCLLLCFFFIDSAYAMPSSIKFFHKNSVPFYEMLDSPVVISLSRHQFRFETTKKLMEEAGFTNILKFEAIDGFNTSDEFFETLNILGGGQGQKGCTASHLTLWREFYENPNSKKYLFVCEDDMLPHSQFYDLFPLYWTNTPGEFDIAMVGNQLGAGECKNSNRHVVSIPTFTTHAYIISKKGAKKLYDLYMQIPKSSGNLHVIDIFLIQAMSNKKFIFYCYNGRLYPDQINSQKGRIVKDRDGGICFQNAELGTTIRSVDICY